jgi:hypothetical protein
MDLDLGGDDEMPRAIVQRSRLAWRKALRSSGDGACVEVAPAAGSVAVRDSKDCTGPMLRFDATAWRVFLARVKSDVTSV